MGEEGHSGFKPRPRIQTLSDLIFGLALSIGALSLVGKQPTSFGEVTVSLAFFSFSFLILVGVWRSYSTILNVLPVETETLTSLNILLLFTVSVEPYLFNLLFTTFGNFWNNVSMLFAVDLAGMFLILAFFNHALADETKDIVPKSYLREYKASRNFDLLMTGIFLVSMVPVFAEINLLQIVFGEGYGVVPLRVFFWIAALILGLVRRLYSFKKKK